MVNVFNIPPGEKFLDCLAEAILGKHLPLSGPVDTSPLAICEYTILVPTRRAAKALAEAFLTVNSNNLQILPNIRPLGDAEEYELLFANPDIEFTVNNELEAEQLTPSLPVFSQNTILAKLILCHGADKGKVFANSFAKALALAQELTRIIDNFAIEQVSLSEISKAVEDGDYAEHWQDILEFLEIITEQYPDILKQRKLLNRMERRNILLAQEATRLNETSKPIIAAGSTGSIPATSQLLAKIATLPNGAVILPGLDIDLDADSWDKIEESHPQFAMRNLLKAMNIEREDVRVLPNIEVKQTRRARVKLLSEVMRPAVTTDKWHRTIGAISDVEFAKAIEGIRLIEAKSNDEEALAIALIMREALEHENKTVALVTHDRNLARRVANDLKRWRIDINDAAGYPLAFCEAAIYLKLVAKVAEQKLAPQAVAELLKQPMLELPKLMEVIGDDLLEKDRLYNKFELLVLRGLRAHIADYHDLKDHFNQKITAGETDKDEINKLKLIASELCDNFFPLLDLFSQSEVNIKELLQAHISLCEKLCAIADNGECILWYGDIGKQLSALFTELLSSQELPEKIFISEYLILLDVFMAGLVVGPKSYYHPRLLILGALESRLMSFDTIILAGLNEKNWPPDVNTDPWLNRQMLQLIGLPAPERRLGLAAHDFVQAAAASDVYLVRSQKDNGSPTVSSRWLLRLLAIIEGRGKNKSDIIDRQWLELAAQIDRNLEPIRIEPPNPKPPLVARPKSLSVTQIETWVKNPYDIYIAHILKIKEIDPVAKEPSALDKGIVIHAIMEEFSKNSQGADIALQVSILQEIAQEKFANWLIYPDVVAFWWPRFNRVIPWFIEHNFDLQKDATSQLTEVEGSYFIAPYDFTIKARADRIDILPHGKARIYDYKTGTLPSFSDVKTGLSPQMTLQGKILSAGGFAGIEAKNIDDLIYIKLSGGIPAGEITKIRYAGRAKENDLDKLIDDTYDGLLKRIAAFANPQTPYMPVNKSKYARMGNFDHLSRHREWGSFSDDEA